MLVLSYIYLFLYEQLIITLHCYWLMAVTSKQALAITLGVLLIIGTALGISLYFTIFSEKAKCENDGGKW